MRPYRVQSGDEADRWYVLDDNNRTVALCRTQHEAESLCDLLNSAFAAGLASMETTFTVSNWSRKRTACSKSARTSQ